MLRSQASTGRRPGYQRAVGTLRPSSRHVVARHPRHVVARHPRSTARPTTSPAIRTPADKAAGTACSTDAEQRSLPQTLVAAALAACISVLAVCAPPTALALPPGKAEVSAEQLRSIVEEDFVKRRYMLTGDMSFDVYADDAHFVDSNNDFGRPGVRKWADSLKKLLDSERSKLALTGPVVLDDKERTITWGWKQVNFFKLPGSPHTSIFSGRNVLKLDPVDNIIVEHSEIWDLPPGEVIKGLKFFDKSYVPPGF